MPADLDIVDIFAPARRLGYDAQGQIFAHRSCGVVFLRVVGLAKRDLPFARQIPIDKNPRRIGMRMIVHQDNRAIVGAEAGRFLEMIRAHFRYRKPLLLRPPQPAKNTDLILTGGQPIGALPKVAEVGNIHLAIKSLKELRSDLRMMIHKKQRGGDVIGARP